MTDDELAGAVTVMTGLALRLYRVHMALVWPAMLAMSRFQRSYDPLTQQLAGVNALDLVGPLDITETIATAETLWRSARAMGVGATTAVETPYGEGASFLAGDTGGSGSLLTAYRSYVESVSPVDAFRRAAATREGVVRRIASAFPGDVSAFLGALRLACEGATVYETHGNLLHERPARQLARLLAEAGRRLAGRRRIDHPDDVEFLTAAELDEHIRGHVGGRLATAALREQRAEFLEWSNWHPPRILGDDPALPEQDRGRCLFVELLRLLYAPRIHAQKPYEKGSTLIGTGAAAGHVVGRARLISQATDAAGARTGDVLVSHEGEAWLGRLLPIAGGLVAEGGCALLHACVTARALGRPAVVEAAGASTSIADGDLIEVDGAAGVVRVLQRGR